MEKIAELKNEEKQKIKDTIAEKEELITEARQQLLNMAAEFKVLTEAFMDAEDRRLDHKGKLDSLDAKIESSKRKQNEHLQAQENCEKVIERKQAEIEAATEQASNVGPRVSSNRHKTQIQRDINKRRTEIQVGTKN